MRPATRPGGCVGATPRPPTRPRGAVAIIVAACLLHCVGTSVASCSPPKPLPTPTAAEWQSHHLGVLLSKCALQNNCNGHGLCNPNTRACSCFHGWGSATDLTLTPAAMSPDCSKRVCPSGKAWFDVPTSATNGHAFAECSNAGVCDRDTGKCTCLPNYTGAACDRSKCPNDCSGHGRCVALSQLKSETRVAPVGPALAVSYGGDECATTWDQDSIYVCVCDTRWEVGLGNLQVQEPEYFGPDCSKRHCPSGDNIMTPAAINVESSGRGKT